jgi:ribosomal protein RSM22 (predicted rRNA methylase)
VLNKLGGDEEAAALVRTKEPAFRDHKFNVDTKASVAKNLAKVPRLMERPLALYNGRAAIGRPLENILAIVRVDGTEVKPADKPSTESTQTAAAEPAAGATPAGAAPPSRGRGKVSAPATDVDAEAAAAINKKASTKLATKPATESKHADAGRVTRSGRTTSK